METIEPDNDSTIGTDPTLARDGGDPDSKPPTIRLRGRPGPKPKIRPPMPVADTDGVEIMSDDAGDTGTVNASSEAPPTSQPDSDILPSGKKKLPPTPALTNIRRAEDQSISNWLTTIKSGGAPIRIAIHRNRPTMHNGKNTKGYLQTVSDMITDEELQQLFGGGTYDLRVTKRNESGQYVYWTSTTIDVGGDPRTDNLPGQAPSGQPAAAPVDRTVENRLMSMVERDLENARQIRDTPPRGADLGQLSAMMKPYELQIENLQRQLEARDIQMRDLIASKDKSDPFQAKMLDKLIDGDSARVGAVRDQLMSEIRVVKENAREDEKRLRDQYERDLSLARTQHQREMDQIKASHERELASIRMAFDTQKEVLSGQNRALERDNVELRSDVKSLRDKKEPSILDKAKELEAIKKAVGGDETETAEKSTIEKVADAAMSSDKLFDFLGKWVGGKPAPGAAQQQLQAQQQGPKFVRQRSTGQVFARQADGQYAAVQPPNRRRRQQPVAAAGGVAQGEVGADGQVAEEEAVEVQIDHADIERAVGFLEAAFRNNIQIENVISTARSAVPEAIVVAIRDLGIDKFLTQVVKLPSTSPLSTQAGRNWCRKLGKALIEE